MNAVGRLLAWPLLALVWLYSNVISPLIGASCRYQPTCSAYAREALQHYGAFKGGYLALKRIGRCHPWGGSGFDPVPENDETANLKDDAALTDAERTKILSHAYGFISRNDREGGLAHIQTYIDASANPASDYHWFLNEMFEWESKDDALFFAQRYLTYLLDLNAQIDAMKLIVRCRLENSAFRPLRQDRERALAVARQLQHDELEKYLSTF